MSLLQLAQEAWPQNGTGKSQNPRPGDSMVLSSASLADAVSGLPGMPAISRQPPFGIIKPKCLASVRPSTRGPGKRCEQYSPMSVKAR